MPHISTLRCGIETLAERMSAGVKFYRHHRSCRLQRLRRHRDPRLKKRDVGHPISCSRVRCGPPANWQDAEEQAARTVSEPHCSNRLTLWARGTIYSTGFIASLDTGPHLKTRRGAPDLLQQGEMWPTRHPTPTIRLIDQAADVELVQTFPRSDSTPVSALVVKQTPSSYSRRWGKTRASEFLPHQSPSTQDYSTCNSSPARP